MRRSPERRVRTATYGPLRKDVNEAGVEDPIQALVDRGSMEVEGSTPAARISVALIDSDMDVRRAVQLRLRAGLFEVRAFASGWAMLAENGPRIDCVVVRDRMTEIDGFELLRRLRDRNWQGPAILVTSTPSLELAAAAARAGFSSVVDRPLVDDLMLHAVDAATRAMPEIVV